MNVQELKDKIDVLSTKLKTEFKALTDRVAALEAAVVELLKNKEAVKDALEDPEGTNH